MSPELLSRFEPVTRAQLKSKVVTNRISQFFAVDSERVEGKDPLVFRFLGERIPTSDGPKPRGNLFSIVLLSATWKGLSRIRMAWW
jgi:hypothetical protein